MPATALTPLEASNAYSTTGYLLSLVNCDSANSNEFATNGGTVLLIVQNPTGSDRSITVTSQPDPVYGRTADVSVSVVANTTRVIRLTKDGWANSTGKITLNGHADLKVAVVQL
jgi:hypothetical protein